MEIKIKKEIGNTSMEVLIEEKDEKDALARATFYMAADVCGNCGSTDITWQSNKAKTDQGMFTYIKRHCNQCHFNSTAGEYKEGGYFWKNWEAFIPKA